MSIPTLIVSKDRAAQLDLLLNSIDKNAHGLFDISVIFKSSNDFFWRGYERLADIWKNIKFQEEWIKPEVDFFGWLNRNEHDLTVLFADDCIFYRPCMVWEDDLLRLFNMQNMWSFSYRLGDNITVQDYTRNTTADKPTIFAEKYNSIFWDYRRVKPDHSFGWPCGIDAFVYRTRDLKWLLEGKSFASFNDLEGLMIKSIREKSPSQYLMACPLQSNVFVQQINIVHDKGLNNIGKFRVSLQELNEKFISGERISLESMSFEGINCSHGEIEWKYK